MDTKKWIKFLKFLRDEVDLINATTNYKDEIINEIIRHLQVWEYFKKEWVYVEADCGTSLNPKYDQCIIEYLLEKFERKHFPKDIEKSAEYKECMEAIKKLSKEEGYKLLLELAMERLEKYERK